jgi:uncharacterized repeat protein (TIGR02543 family)
MDKNTLSHYGLILVSTLIVIALMALLSPLSPFGFSDNVQEAFNKAVQTFIDKTQIEEVDNSGDSSTGGSGTGTKTERTIVIKHLFESGKEASAATVVTIPYGTTYNFSVAVKDLTGYTASSVPLKQIITKNAEFEIIYIPQTFTISYETNGGTIISNAVYTYKYGDTVLLPLTVIKEGYTFAGWFNNNKFTGDVQTEIPAFQIPTSPDKNTTYYAKWIENQYTITYVSEGNVISHTPNTLKYGVSETLKPLSNNGNKKFAGWYLNDSFIGDVQTATPKYPTENITYYAKWQTADTFAIDYITNGGVLKNNTSANYTSGSIHLLPNDDEISRKGYTFLGWYDNPSFYGNPITSIKENETGEKSFYAKWEQDIYTIAYNTKGGDIIEIPRTTYKYGDVVVLPKQVTKQGYTFNGWLHPFNSSILIHEIDGTFSGDLVIEALWTPKAYDVTFDANGGTINATEEFTNMVFYDSIYPDLEGVKPYREGFDFLGWYNEQDQLIDIYAETKPIYNVDGNTILKAKWKPKQMNLTYVFYDSLSESIVPPSAYDYLQNIFNKLPSQVQYGTRISEIVPLDAPQSKLFYWYEDSSFGNQFSNTDTIVRDTTLYCTISPNTFNITYSLSGGELYTELASYTYGSEETLPIPYREGYTFVSWECPSKGLTLAPTLDSDVIEVIIPKDVYGDLDLVATWEEKVDSAQNFKAEFILYDVLTGDPIKIDGKVMSTTLEGLSVNTEYTITENQLIGEIEDKIVQENIQNNIESYDDKPISNVYYHNEIKVTFTESDVLENGVLKNNITYNVPVEPYKRLKLIPLCDNADITENFGLINEDGSAIFKFKQNEDVNIVLPKYSTKYLEYSSCIPYKLNATNNVQFEVGNTNKFTAQTNISEVINANSAIASALKNTTNVINVKVYYSKATVTGNITFNTAGKVYTNYTLNNNVISNATEYNGTLKKIYNSTDFSILEKSPSCYVGEIGISSLPIPVANCQYEFIGWARTVNGQLTIVENIPVNSTGNISLTAIWKVRTTIEDSDHYYNEDTSYVNNGSTNEPCATVTRHICNYCGNEKLVTVYNHIWTLTANDTDNTITRHCSVGNCNATNKITFNTDGEVYKYINGHEYIENGVFVGTTKVPASTLENTLLGEKYNNVSSTLEYSISFYLIDNELILPTPLRHCDYQFVGWAYLNDGKYDICANIPEGINDDIELTAIWVTIPSNESATHSYELIDVTYDESTCSITNKYRCNKCDEIYEEVVPKHSYDENGVCTICNDKKVN